MRIRDRNRLIVGGMVSGSSVASGDAILGNDAFAVLVAKVFLTGLDLDFPASKTAGKAHVLAALTDRQ